MKLNPKMSKILIATFALCLAFTAAAEQFSAKKHQETITYQRGESQKVAGIEDLEKIKTQLSCPRGAQAVVEKSAHYEGDPGIVVGSKRADGTFDGPYTIWYRTSANQSAAGSLYKALEGLYSNGKKTGKWMSWREDGSKIEQGKYVADKKQGLWTTWYQNGQKEKELEFDKGVERGLEVHWYENGQKGIECHVDGWLPGPDGGKPVKKLVGRYTNWDGSGRKTMEGFYSADGEGTGTWTTWSDNGTKEQSEFKDGKRDGDWIIWRPNGKKMVQGKWKNGERVGPTTYWNEKGKIDHVEK
jgi:antitoxin component YwqK of YwqJK toxin-antitoxin module